jgi:hypothetical protein
MTSSDGKGAERQPGKSAAELEAEGWQRCFIADEPRLSEAVETYEELGFQVRLLPVPLEEIECTECMRQDPDRFRVIYTRKEER